MGCSNCDEQKTIKAHLIPNAFVKEVKVAQGEQIMVVHKDAKAKVSNTGIYDPMLLCGPCDSRLGAHEGYVYKLLKQLRLIEAPLHSLVPLEPVDGDAVVRFAAGIAWKFANTREEWGRIEIGPYSHDLREVALRGALIPTSVDVA